tara:strand:+ start:9017 stop:11521 length:2505 start_codon:yes stop_codon:yes gene_type:complete
MSSHDRLRQLLPSVWRPEPGEETLLESMLGAVGQVVDTASVQNQHVMRSHWAGVADAAIWDAHYQTARKARGLDSPNVLDPEDVRELSLYPYIGDLARVASLLRLSPWLEPAGLRESVEEYRQRIRDVLEAYQLGLTTHAAIRRLCMAALPEDLSLPLAEQRWPFAIEEPVRLGHQLRQITVPEAQEGDLLSALYRWTVDAAPGAPEVFIQGVEAVPEEVGETVGPAIERFTPGKGVQGVALAYEGTLAPGQTLRLLPARRSCLSVDGALQISQIEDEDNYLEDPSLNGPWAALPDVPEGRVHLLTQSMDRCLWIAVETDSRSVLHRYDGRGFRRVVNTPAVHFTALLAWGEHVFIGTASGLFRVPLFEKGRLSAVAIADISSPVHQLSVVQGYLVCAHEQGLSRLSASGNVFPEALIKGLPVRAVHEQGDRLYVASEKALLLFQQQRWFTYKGQSLSENLPDWHALAQADLADAVSPLPLIKDMATTADGSLWLATADGFARYRVHDGRTTQLEAFPDLGRGAVHQLHVDDRGMLWLATAQGLFRFDGSSIAQQRLGEARWQRMGDASLLYPDALTSSPRGHWHYLVAQKRWEAFDNRQRKFINQDITERQAAEADIPSLCLIAAVRADLGTFDGNNFQREESAAQERLRVRIKPDEQTIVDGGLPALPETPGQWWRYLQLDERPRAPRLRPWWSSEGQYFGAEQGDDRIDLPGRLEPGREIGLSPFIPDFALARRQPWTPAPWPGHFRDPSSPGEVDGHFEQSVFAYPPSGRVWMRYAVAPAIGVRVRLFKSARDESVDPALIDRVWELLTRAKAAAVPLELTLEAEIVRGV